MVHHSTIMVNPSPVTGCFPKWEPMGAITLPGSPIVELHGGRPGRVVLGLFINSRHGWAVSGLWKTAETHHKHCKFIAGKHRWYHRWYIWWYHRWYHTDYRLNDSLSILEILQVRIYYWLVVYLPLWKIWVRHLGWWHAQYMGKYRKIKVMFQSPPTTLNSFKICTSEIQG